MSFTNEELIRGEIFYGVFLEENRGRLEILRHRVRFRIYVSVTSFGELAANLMECEKSNEQLKLFLNGNIKSSKNKKHCNETALKNVLSYKYRNLFDLGSLLT